MVGLLAYLRHKSACNLRAVRDNPPWDDLCNCGLRETWRDALADTAGIDAAWQAAETALPEGWDGPRVGPLYVLDHDSSPFGPAHRVEGMYAARAINPDNGAYTEGEGPTPAAALLALDAVLRTPETLDVEPADLWTEDMIADVEAEDLPGAEARADIEPVRLLRDLCSPEWHDCTCDVHEAARYWLAGGRVKP